MIQLAIKINEPTDDYIKIADNLIANKFDTLDRLRLLPYELAVSKYRISDGAYFTLMKMLNE